jgi:hypothetical protein
VLAHEVQVAYGFPLVVCDRREVSRVVASVASLCEWIRRSVLEVDAKTARVARGRGQCSRVDTVEVPIARVRFLKDGERLIPPP